jgi:hypothetical protein
MRPSARVEAHIRAHISADSSVLIITPSDFSVVGLLCLPSARVQRSSLSDVRTLLTHVRLFKASNDFGAVTVLMACLRVANRTDEVVILDGAEAPSLPGASRTGSPGPAL